MLQRLSAGVFLCVLLISSSLLLSDSATSHLVVPPDSQCACLHRVLTYTCTVVGKGSTIWNGTAFDCTNNFINLRHSLFNDSNSRGATGDCNGGAIVGRSIGVTDNCYTSQLSVRVAADMNNRTICCNHRPGTEIITVGKSKPNVITAPLPPPSDVHPMSLLQGNLTFQWTSVAPACFSKLDYKINSTNCGNCILTSSSASATNATCSNIPMPMITCSFSVQTMVCENQVGEQSSPVEITLKVPDVPHVLNILPVYSLDGTVLAAKAVITNNLTIHAYDGFSVPVTSYKFSFSNSTSGVVLDSVNTSPCSGDVCEYIPDVSTYCRSMGSISVAVSAANELGIGSQSDPVSIECANKLVEVVYDSASSIITCTFNDPRNITDKSCTIEYEICNSQQQRQTLNGSSTQKSPNIVTLKLSSIDPNRMYCYNVTASNDSYTVIVMGNIGMDGGKSYKVVVIVIVILLIIAIALTLFVVTILVILYPRRYKRLKHKNQVKLSDLEQPDSIRQELQLTLVQEGRFESYNVNNDCQLRDFLPNNLKFRRGCAYYEFEHEVEHISEDKQLIFMKDNDFFSPTIDSKKLKSHGFLGEKVSRPVGSDYRVFVQSKSGSGCRHLPSGSMLLYDCHEQGTKVPSGSLRPLVSDHFKVTKVDKECSLKVFCSNHGISANRFVIFLELGASEGKGEVRIRDVLLAKNEATETQQSRIQLFTGPSMRQAVVSAASDDLRKLQEEYRIFFVEEKRFSENLILKKDSFVLHERCCLENERFHVLKVAVTEDNMQMSTFIKSRLGSFENGQAFYEFIGHEEDLVYYKQVINILTTEKMDDGDSLKLKPDVSLFYSLTGVPGLGIPPDKQHIRVFIQSTSYGSRCLRAGATVLYKMVDRPEHST